MKKIRGMLCACVTLLGAPAWAASDQPYAGQQLRDIKALSGQQVTGYLEGKGMGFAKAAELNHYPGPRHVLDLADQLSLSEAQQKASQALFERMQQEAKALGRQLVAAERDLDHLFASQTVTKESLVEATRRIAILRGELRYTHLKTHLAQRELLTNDQLLRYDRLRGYDENGGDHAGHAGHHGAH